MLNSSPQAQASSLSPSAQNWVALSIGNTHWKWGYFAGAELNQVWTTPPQPFERVPEDWSQWCRRSPALAWHHQQGQAPFPLLRVASVVEADQALWQSYPQMQLLTLDEIPIQNLYAGLGIDRALAVLGAGQQYGWPVLVIDAGTALTFSGADQTGFKGGAIASGLGLQLSMLNQQTAALPQLTPSAQLPVRWATDTDTAILSGVLLGILSSLEDFCRDWTQTYPQSSVVFTGGDGALLLALYRQHQSQTPSDFIAASYYHDAHLIFYGMAVCEC